MKAQKEKSEYFQIDFRPKFLYIIIKMRTKKRDQKVAIVIWHFDKNIYVVGQDSKNINFSFFCLKFLIKCSFVLKNWNKNI